MRGLVLAVGALAIAAPAAADVAMMRLPLPPRGMDYVETDCFLDMPRRHEVVRVQINGKVLRMSMAKGFTVGRATRAEAQRVMRLLDGAPFRDRLVPRDGPDYTECTLIRVRGGATDRVKVQMLHGWGSRPTGLYAALASMDSLGRRATQPGTLGSERK